MFAPNLVCEICGSATPSLRIIRASYVRHLIERAEKAESRLIQAVNFISTLEHMSLKYVSSSLNNVMAYFKS